ncbi:ATP-binding cassette domain-containing protein [bacterium]|nr:ATP-binding cassette domain-containing protein [bacterium]
MKMKLTGVTVRHGAFALGPVSAEVPAGIIGLMGPNGAGKSTLLKAMAGALPMQGEVQADGRDWARMEARKRAGLVGYLPQHPQLSWDMKVEDVVALGLLPMHGIAPAERRRFVLEALALCQAESWAGLRYGQLSGGQKQRVMLARALVGKPALLLLDEPCASLDPAQQLELMALFQRLFKEGLTLWVVCHDLAFASRFCHHILLFEGGRLVAEGLPKQVLDKANLKRCFGIEAKTVGNASESCILPWKTAG